MQRHCAPTRARVLRGGCGERAKTRESKRASEQVVGRVPFVRGRRREGRKEEERSGRTPSQTWSESQSGKVIDTVQRIYGCIGAEERRRRRRRRLSRVSTWAVVVLGAGVEAKVGMGQMLPSCRSLFFRVQGFKVPVKGLKSFPHSPARINILNLPRLSIMTSPA